MMKVPTRPMDIIIDFERARSKLVGTHVTIKGVGSPSKLVMNKFSEKLIQQMSEKHQGMATPGRQAKDPTELFNAARHLDQDGKDCFPSTALKNAIANLGWSTMRISRSKMLGSVFFEQGLIPIKYETCQPIMSLVRNANGQPDTRWRAEYLNWSAEFDMFFKSSTISGVQLFQLLDEAGLSNGLGEGRTEKCALDWGSFEIVSA